MWKILILVGSCLAQQAVFPPTGFNNVGALSSGLPGISVSQTRSPTTYNTLNQTITFTITISNPGTATLVGPITITDAKLGTNLACTGNIAAGGMATCSPNPTYNVTQADLDSGSFNVAATATAAGSGISASASTLTTTAVQNPSILLSKTPSTSSWSTVPTTINYTFAVQNTGNVTLSAAINITDPKTGGVSNCGGAGGLAPTLTKMCSASYTTVSGDSGSNIVNTATAATTFGGMTYMDTRTATVTFSSGATILLTNYGGNCTANFDNTGAFRSAFTDATKIYGGLPAGSPPIILQIPNGTCEVFASSMENNGACDILYPPSNVSIEGGGKGVSKILTTHYPDSPPCGSQLYTIQWNYYIRSNYHNATAYNTFATTSGNSTVQLRAPTDTSHFAIRDYVILYERNPNMGRGNAGDPPSQVSPFGNTLTQCDVCPSELNQITAINSSTGLITLAHPWARSFPDYINYSVSGCTGCNLYPTLGNVTVYTLHNGGLKNLDVQGANPFDWNEVSDMTLTNVTFYADAGIASTPNGTRRYGYNMQSNGVFWSTLTNVDMIPTFPSGGSGIIGGEWWQDNSGDYTWNGGVWGVSGGPPYKAISAFSCGEFCHGNMNNITFYLFGPGGGNSNGLGFGGRLAHFDGNTLTMVSGTYDAPNGGVVTDQPNPPSCECINAGAYENYQTGGFIQNNTFTNCNAPGDSCLISFTNQMTIAGNSFTSSAGAGLTLYNFADVSSDIVNNNQFATANAQALNFTGNTNHGWQVTNNHRNSGGGINISPGSGGGTCVVSGNTNWGLPNNAPAPCTGSGNSQLTPLRPERFTLANLFALANLFRF